METSSRKRGRSIALSAIASPVSAAENGCLANRPFTRPPARSKIAQPRYCAIVSKQECLRKVIPLGEAHLRNIVTA